MVRAASNATVPPTPRMIASSGALLMKANARQESTTMMWRMANSTSLLKLRHAAHDWEEVAPSAVGGDIMIA